MRIIQADNLVHVQTTKRAEYKKCEKAAEKLADYINSAVAAEETDDEPEFFEASFAIGKGAWTCEEVREAWREVKLELAA